MFLPLKKDCEILPIDRSTAKFLILKRYPYAVAIYEPTCNRYLMFGFRSLDEAHPIAKTIAECGNVTCLGVVSPSDVLLDPSDAVLKVLIRFEPKT